MTKAEEAAFKAYPVYGKWIGNQYGYWDNDINSTLRKVYLQGYEQAQKDIIALIQSRIDEILGDAQPKPARRAELHELIKKIEK